ncbi:hypothetical protein D3C78_1530710 [compost metagenome]
MSELVAHVPEGVDLSRCGHHHRDQDLEGRERVHVEVRPRAQERAARKDLDGHHGPQGHAEDRPDAVGGLERALGGRHQAQQRRGERQEQQHVQNRHGV